MIPGLCSLFYRGGTSGGLSVVASPANLGGSSGQTTVGPSVAMPIGGTAPYTYAWTYYTGDLSVTAGSPTAASTNFSIPSLLPGDSTSAIFYCTVTDSGANVAQSNQVFMTFYQST